MGNNNENDEIASSLYANREMVRVIFGDRYEMVLRPWREVLRNATQDSGKPMALVALSIAKHMEARGSHCTHFILAAFVDELEAQKEAPGVTH